MATAFSTKSLTEKAWPSSFSFLRKASRAVTSTFTVWVTVGISTAEVYIRWATTFLMPVSFSTVSPSISSRFFTGKAVPETAAGAAIFRSAGAGAAALGAASAAARMSRLTIRPLGPVPVRTV